MRARLLFATYGALLSALVAPLIIQIYLLVFGSWGPWPMLAVISFLSGFATAYISWKRLALDANSVSAALRISYLNAFFLSLILPAGDLGGFVIAMGAAICLFPVVFFASIPCHQVMCELRLRLEPRGGANA